MAEAAYAAGRALLGAPRLLSEKIKQIKQTTKRQKSRYHYGQSSASCSLDFSVSSNDYTLSSLLHRITGTILMMN